MIYALDRILSPLARLLVARGLLFAEAAERLKHHYVQAAERAGDGKATDSRISVLTGLQRRDIARLRRAPPDTGRAPNPLARLVAQWQVLPGYSAGGQPQPLPLKGPAPSFDALARSIRQDVHPRTMLDTLLAAGTVAQDAGAGTVRLQSRSYQPLAGSEAQLDYLAQNTGDHLDAAVGNVLAARPAHFERAVHYNQLTPQAVAELEAQFRAGQMALLEAVSARAAVLQAQAPAGASTRFRAGGYFYSENEGTPE